MITEREFYEANKLTSYIEELSNLIGNFNDHYVLASIGIVALYPNNSSSSPEPHDSAGFFNSLTDIKVMVNKVVISLLKEELLNKKIELSKYLGETK